MGVDGQSCPRISITNHNGRVVIPRLIEVKIYSFVLGHREPYNGMGVGACLGREPTVPVASPRPQ